MENLLSSVLSGAGAGALVFGLAKSVLTERIKNAIKHEYDVKLEGFKSETRAHELVGRAKWETKRTACLRALHIVNAYWSNLKLTGLDARGKQIDSTAIDKQDPPKTEEVRACYNNLILSCDSDEVLRKFKHCLLLTSDSFKADDIVDLRNAIRRELGFGADIDFDRANAFIARIKIDT